MNTTLKVLLYATTKSEGTTKALSKHRSNNNFEPNRNVILVKVIHESAFRTRTQYLDSCEARVKALGVAPVNRVT